MKILASYEACGSCNTAQMSYAFYFKRSSNAQWKVIGTEFGDATEARFKPTAADKYDVKVVIKDSDGHTAEKVMTVNVK